MSIFKTKKRSYIDEERRSVLPGFVCKAHAEKLSCENAKLYTDAELLEAKKFHQMVKNAFMRSQTYLNIRETFIAIKIDRPVIQDRISNEVAKLNDYANAKGYECKGFGRNIIYRIPRIK